MTLTGEVLIVDDMPQNLQVLGSMLRAEGLSVRLAPSGAYALRSVAARRPDLILLDIRMGEMDGFETCRRLRAEPDMAAVPVLFLSASQDPEERIASFTAGGLDFISKPFNAEEVLVRVSTHLSLARLRRELAVANERLADQVVSESSQRQQIEAVARDQQVSLEFALSAADMGSWTARDHSSEFVLGQAARDILSMDDHSGSLYWTDLVNGFHESDRASIESAWLDGLKNTPVFEIEGWWTRTVARRRIRIRICTLVESDARVRLHGLVWDVTEEYTSRQRHAQSEKMEALGQLAGGMAHDFNNHLQVIIGNLELVRSKIENDPWIFQRLSSIDRAASTATALIHDLLSFARRRDITASTIALAPMVTDLESMLRCTLGSHVSLVVWAVESGISVVGNREKLQNALLNLCVNARDAMPNGGQISITVTREEVRGIRCRICNHDVNGTYAVVSVRDNGCGIPIGTQDLIFEPFYTTKPEGSGTGLGLVTVVGCVKSHHGHLLLDSEAGKGTDFRILLPLAEDQRKGSETRSIQAL